MQHDAIISDLAADIGHLFTVPRILQNSIFNEKFVAEILLAVNNVFNDEEDDNTTHFKEL